MSLVHAVLTLVFSILTIRMITKDLYLDALVTNRIIDKDVQNQKNKLLYGLSSLYMVGSAFIFMVPALKGNIFSLGMAVYIIFSHVLAIIITEFKPMNRIRLIRYSVKRTDTPEAVITFKVDAMLLLKDMPKHLKLAITLNEPLKLSTSTTKEDDLPLFKELMNYLDKNNQKNYFPLYEEFLIFMSFVKDPSVDADSSIINAYIFENITLLSTIMSILKNEKLVTSLKADLGKQDLEKLTQQVKDMNTELNRLTTYIKQEEITFSKALGTSEVIDGLNEIRSMQSFIEMVK